MSGNKLLKTRWLTLNKMWSKILGQNSTNTTPLMTVKLPMIVMISWPCRCAKSLNVISFAFFHFQDQSQNDLSQQHCLLARTATSFTVPLVLSSGEIHSRHFASNIFQRVPYRPLEKWNYFLEFVFFACSTILSRDCQSLVRRAINEAELVRELCTGEQFSMLTRVSSRSRTGERLATVTINKCVIHFSMRTLFYRGFMIRQVSFIRNVPRARTQWQFEATSVLFKKTKTTFCRKNNTSCCKSTDPCHLTQLTICTRKLSLVDHRWQFKWIW